MTALMSAGRVSAALLVTGDEISRDGADWHRVLDIGACTRHPLCDVYAIGDGDVTVGLHLHLGAEVWVRRPVGIRRLQDGG